VNTRLGNGEKTTNKEYPVCEVLATYALPGVAGVDGEHIENIYCAEMGFALIFSSESVFFM
jgi:hypothetical protein